MSHLFLTGFMGAGKSTVGRAVAERLDRRFVDLDAEIERREGATVPALFEVRGEAGFREAEHAALGALEGTPDAVVATGGGVVLREDNGLLLGRLGTVVYLAVTPEEAMARLGGAANRPLLAGRGMAAAAEILGARLALYRATADHVVDTTGRDAASVTDAVVAIASEPPTRTIVVGAGTTDAYDVVIGGGLIDEVGPRLRETLASSQVALVTDDAVGPLYRRRVAASVGAAGMRISEHTVPAGERSKSWERAGALLERFAESGLDRGSAVIALGGGVVGDLAGFCAASYMRGIPVVQVPTTLLAQVDSSIGGKTAVDLDAGKNLAGAFWQPALVLSDVAVLDTLPESEWVNGLVEVVKTALLAGEEALAALEADLDDVLLHDHAAVSRTVANAASFKAGVVSADERETGLRECLNLGHTLGHALETVVGYGSLAHGVAVAEGLRFAAQLAEEITGAPRDLTDRIAALLERVGAFPLGMRVDAETVLAAMRSDKKSRGGVVRFVLLEAPGRWQTVEVADDVLAPALVRWTSRNSEGMS